MPSRRIPTSAQRPRGLARLLDALALAFALAWVLAAWLGARAWPAPSVLHLWSLSAPLFLAGAALSVARRRPLGALLHGVLLVAWAVPHTPRLAGGAEPVAGALAFATLNAGNGRAAPEDLVRWARAQAADALFLQELDAAQAAALERECTELYPFRELHGLGLRGVGVLARRPLADLRRLELDDGSLALLGRIEFDGHELGGHELAFAVVHLSAWVMLLGPWGGADEALARVQAELAGAPLALVAGDLNLTSESPLLDGLRAAGFRSAFDAVGSGLGLSFPVFLRYRGLPLPPLARIDHVFLRGLEPHAARYGSGVGSDHRALRVETRAPLGP